MFYGCYTRERVMLSLHHTPHPPSWGFQSTFTSMRIPLHTHIHYTHNIQHHIKKMLPLKTAHSHMSQPCPYPDLGGSNPHPLPGGPLHIILHIHFCYTYNIQPQLKHMLPLEQLTAKLANPVPTCHWGIHSTFHECHIFMSSEISCPVMPKWIGLLPHRLNVPKVNKPK